MSLPSDPFEMLQARYPKLSGGQKRVVRFLLETPTEAAFLSTAALGERVRVSDSTVVRLADAVGYDNYPKLRAAIRDSLYRRVTPSAQFHKAMSETGTSMDASLQADMINLRGLNVPVVWDALRNAVTTIVAASSVYVLGFYSSFAPALGLAYLLEQIRDGVHLFSAEQGGISRQLIEVVPGSCLVAFSLPRYSRDTYRITERAKDAGATVIAVTDSLASPIAQLGRVTVTVSCHSSSFFNSQVACMAVANILASEVAKQIPDQAEARLKRYERMRRSFGGFLAEDEKRDEDVSDGHHDPIGKRVETRARRRTSTRTKSRPPRTASSIGPRRSARPRKNELAEGKR